jgi:hypothetical protein
MRITTPTSSSSLKKNSIVKQSRGPVPLVISNTSYLQKLRPELRLSKASCFREFVIS